MRRGGGQCREHGQRFELGREAGVHAGVGGEIIAQEQQVELPLFGDARDLLDHADILEALAGAGVAPAGDVVTGSEDEDPEMHLPRHAAVLRQDRPVPSRPRPVSRWSA